MESKKMLVAGFIVLDIIPEVYIPKGQPIPEILLSEGRTTERSYTRIYLDGEVGNTGLGLKELERDVRLVSKIGDDSVGEIVREILNRYDIDYTLIEMTGEQSSASVAIALSGRDKMTLHSRRTSQFFKAADITGGVLEGVKPFHFGYPPSMKCLVESEGEELEDLLKGVESKGTTISLDMSLSDLKTFLGHVSWRPILQRTLLYVDLPLPNLGESIFFLHRENYVKVACKVGVNNLLDYANVRGTAEKLAGELLEMDGTMVMLKYGRERMYLRITEKGGQGDMGKTAPNSLNGWCDRRTQQKPAKVKRILSRTGAGGTAVAGFLSSFLHEDNAKAALGITAWTASICVQSYDTISGLCPLNEL